MRSLHYGPIRAVLASVAVAAAGCSAAPEGPLLSSGLAPNEEPAEIANPAPVRLNIDITDGRVTPTGVNLEAREAQAIDVRVTSDAADWMIVESEPAQKFWISVGPDQGFGFTPESPGRVVIKLERSGQTVATINSTGINSSGK